MKAKKEVPQMKRTERKKDLEITREKGKQAFISLRAQAAKNFPEGMSLDEINIEIDKARREDKNIK